MDHHQPGPLRLRVRAGSGFTLIEIMMVVVMLGILAALVIPHYTSNRRDARAAAMAANVHHVRDQIRYHASAKDVALTADGYPTVIDPSWFSGGRSPDHTWTLQPMIIEVVAGPANERFPAVKTFDPDTPGDPNAWYNTANGAFCARVPAETDPAETLETFNLANSVLSPTLAAVEP